MKQATLLAVLLGLTQTGCIAIGYSSGEGGWFIWPGGFGLLVLLALLNSCSGEGADSRPQRQLDSFSRWLHPQRCGSTSCRCGSGRLAMFSWDTAPALKKIEARVDGVGPRGHHYAASSQ